MLLFFVCVSEFVVENVKNRSAKNAFLEDSQEKLTPHIDPPYATSQTPPTKLQEADARISQGFLASLISVLSLSRSLADLVAAGVAVIAAAPNSCLE